MATGTKSGKVRHAGITWIEKIDGDYLQRSAMRGEEVELPKAEYDRLARFDAFESEQAPMEADRWPVDGTMAEQQAWLARHSVDEALDEARSDPGQVRPMLDAEQARPAGTNVPRTTLVQALTSALQ